MASTSKVPAERQMRARRGGPVAAHEIDWNNPSDTEVIDFVLTQYDAGRARRLGWEAQAAQQLAWVRGNQNLFWNEELWDLSPEPGEAPSLESRWPCSMNMLRRFVMSYLGMMLARPFTFLVQPSTRNDGDVASARTSTKLLQHYFEIGQPSGMTRLVEALWHTFATGVVWLKPIWDPYRGVVDRITPDDVERCRDLAAKEMQEASPDPEGWSFKRIVELLTGKKDISDLPMEPDGSYALPRGDLLIDYATGFDLTEPYGAVRVEDCGWLIDSRMRSVEYVRERYGEAAAHIVGDDDAEIIRRRRSTELAGHGMDYTGTEGGSPGNELTLVHELWRPRSRLNPKGFRAVVCQRSLMKRGPHPYLHGRLPYIRVSEQPEPEHFRPGCSIRDLMGLQYARNKLRSKGLGHFEMQADPKWLVEKGNDIPDDAFTSGPKVITVKAGSNASSAIKPLPQHPYPSQGNELDGMCRVDMEDVAGVHRSTMGRQEHSGQSGIHAQSMAEGDSRNQAATRILIEEGFSQAGQMCLSLLHQFGTQDRTVQITGPNGEPESLRWSGRNLIGRGLAWHQTRVRCRLSPQVSLADTDRRVESLIKNGVLNPQSPTDKATILRMYGEEYGGPDVDDSTLHRARANVEHADLADGQALEVSAGDDDLIHIMEHRRFQTQAEYRLAREKDPGIDERIETHIREHLYSAMDKTGRPEAIRAVVQQELAAEYRIGGMPAPGGAEPQQGQSPPASRGGARPASGGASPPGGPALRVVGGGR